MATVLSDVKRRINTTAQIRKVTGTLQKVASAKLAQDLRRIGNANVYFHSICRLLRLAHSALPAGTPPHPLMVPRESDTICLVVFGSDRGLCGAFNTLLMNEVHRFVKAHPDKRVHILFRGKVVYRRALRIHMTPIEQMEEPDEIDNRVFGDFTNDKFSEVHMLYWDYVTGVDQNVVVEQVLPTPFTGGANAPIPGTPGATESTRYETEMIEPKVGREAAPNEDELQMLLKAIQTR